MYSEKGKIINKRGIVAMDSIVITEVALSIGAIKRCKLRKHDALVF